MFRVFVAVLATFLLFTSSCQGNVVLNSVNEHCYEYVVVYGSVDWQTAYNYSTNSTYNGLTGYLVTITTNSENTFVYNTTGGNTVWTGGVAVDTFDTYQWYDGPEAGKNISTGSPFTCQQAFCNWYTGQPNETVVGAAIIQLGSPNSGQWDDVASSSQYAFVIEYGNTTQNCSLVSGTPSTTGSSSVSATPSTTGSGSITLTPSVSSSHAGSHSLTPSVSLTISGTPSQSLSSSVTATISITPSSTISVTPSKSISVTPSKSISVTPSISVSSTPSISVTPSISTTPSSSTSLSASISITASSSGTPGNIVNPSTILDCRRRCRRHCRRRHPLATHRQMKRCIKRCVVEKKCFG